jgi:hypothetical protein
MPLIFSSRLAVDFPNRPGSRMGDFPDSLDNEVTFKQLETNFTNPARLVRIEVII